MAAMPLPAMSQRVMDLVNSRSAFPQRARTEPPNSSPPLPSSQVEARNWGDVAVYALLIALAVMQFVLTLRAKDVASDATYVELAKSVARGAPYGFNFKPETMLPPGFPYLLALLIGIVGSSFVVIVRALTVFTALALIFTYELLRGLQSRVAAAAICLLVASTPLVFVYSTRLVFSDMPYFFTSMCLLWTVVHLDSIREGRWKQFFLWLGCLVLLLSSVLIRSTGIALLTGLLAWLAVSVLKDKARARRRLLIFVPLLVFGMATQVAWMRWAVKHQFSEWPIHGYQDNYLTQLRVKSGNYPELGLATWKDVLVRPIYNADDRATELWSLVTRKSVASAWYSPTTTVPLVLVLLGLGSSIWKTGGGLAEWYFLSYEGMYLFWPWDFEERFLLPVVPLACLYLWRGTELLLRMARSKPRRVAAAGIALAAIGIASTEMWGRHIQRPHPELCIAIWIMIVIASAVLFGSKPDQIEKICARANKAILLYGRSVSLGQILGGTAVVALFLLGLAMQARLGAANLHYRAEDDVFYPDIEAAEWIRDHSAPSAVVMARKEDLVYYYGGRRVVWFPPSTDAQLLMNGIRLYHVQYVIVVDGNDNYWRPPAEQCFDALSSAYPTAFTLVHQMPHEKVYEVSAEMADQPNDVAPDLTRRALKSGANFRKRVRPSLADEREELSFGRRSI